MYHMYFQTSYAFSSLTVSNYVPLWFGIGRLDAPYSKILGHGTPVGYL